MKKKIIIIGLICASLIPLSANNVQADNMDISYEEDMDEITPRYANIRQINISGGNCTVTANPSYNINITATVEKKVNGVWKYVSSKSASGKGMSRIYSSAGSGQRVRFYISVGAQIK